MCKLYAEKVDRKDVWRLINTGLNVESLRMKRIMDRRRQVYFIFEMKFEKEKVGRGKGEGEVRTRRRRRRRRKIVERVRRTRKKSEKYGW